MSAPTSLQVRVRYWSWFKDLTGTDTEFYEVPAGADLAALLRQVEARHAPFSKARPCALIAVGVEYQPSTHKLSPGDEVSLFPPVQGG